VHHDDGDDTHGAHIRVDADGHIDYCDTDHPHGAHDDKPPNFDHNHDHHNHNRHHHFDYSDPYNLDSSACAGWRHPG
jgi:hypothetical protein